MTKRSIQKSIRLKPEILDKIESFMKSARVLPDGEERRRKTISNNFTKAFHYLTRSFFDTRRFSDRALFDGTLRDLENLTARLIKTGNDLNDLNKSYFNDSASNTDPTAVLNELSVLFKENNQLLEMLAKSFVLGKNGE